MGRRLVWQYNIRTTFSCLHTVAWKRTQSTNSLASGCLGPSGVTLITNRENEQPYYLFFDYNIQYLNASHIFTHFYCYSTQNTPITPALWQIHAVPRRDLTTTAEEAPSLFLSRPLQMGPWRPVCQNSSPSRTQSSGISQEYKAAWTFGVLTEAAVTDTLCWPVKETVDTGLLWARDNGVFINSYCSSYHLWTELKRSALFFCSCGDCRESQPPLKLCSHPRYKGW